MRKIDFPITILPDIEMYGGDTEPWDVQMVHEDGRNYTMAEVNGYGAVLTIMPFMFSAGLGITAASNILKKNGTIETYGTNDAMAVFKFTASDTSGLSGKYTYQIEFTYGSDKRIGQGNLYIRNNVNR